MNRNPHTVGPASGEPLLETEEIQGNVIIGFDERHQALLALRIASPAGARRWLRRIVGKITSANDLLRARGLPSASSDRSHRQRNSPGGVWVNIAFSARALAGLNPATAKNPLPDRAFLTGLNAERASLLGDAVAPEHVSTNDPTLSWVVGGSGNPVDLILVVASEQVGSLAAGLDPLRPGKADGDSPPQIVWEEWGQMRSDLPGHEHFGFRDNLSQPGVLGLIMKSPDIPLTPRLVAPGEAGKVDFAKPGQALVWPGQFILGYPSTASNWPSQGQALPMPERVPRWAKNGSYLVFRRLRQDVWAFRTYVREQAALLRQKSGYADVTPEFLGALIFGRWASGAPLSRSPRGDHPALGNDDLANNDFLYAVDTPAPAFQDDGPTLPQLFDRAREDCLGLVCPRAAHIRKMNPRDQATNLGDQFDTLTRRILRRSIPYGPPLPEDADDDGVDRGLHFLCYQGSIEAQFETLQRDWANSCQNPTTGGHDLIIGQPSGDSVTRLFVLCNQNSANEFVLEAPRRFVIPTGGGYFFAPSIGFLRETAAIESTTSGKTGVSCLASSGG